MGGGGILWVMFVESYGQTFGCFMSFVRRLICNVNDEFAWCVRGMKLIFSWEQMLEVEMERLGQLIGADVLSKNHIKQCGLLDFFLKKVMVCMWRGTILSSAFNCSF